MNINVQPVNLYDGALRDTGLPRRHCDEFAWTVEAIEDNGEMHKAIFAGPDAVDRAKEYASFKYGATAQSL